MLKMLSVAVLAGMLCVGCRMTPVRTTGAAASPAPPATVVDPLPPGPPPDDNLNAVLWTQTAIERDLVYRQAYRAAEAQLVRALADPDWEALERGQRKRPARGLRNAVIVDVDETVLDNAPYQARLVKLGTRYDEFTWAEWCREARAAAIPGALEFARLAARNGVTVFYLSNRAQDLGEVTLANLRKVGFPIEGDHVFLGLGTFVDGCEQNGSEKGCRRELISRTHRVLMQIGDQIGDLIDVEANTLQGRRDAMAPYLDWIGERWFVLPNPTYGSWESALFNNDRTLPAAGQRAAKQEALRLD